MAIVFQIIIIARAKINEYNASLGALIAQLVDNWEPESSSPTVKMYIILTRGRDLSNFRAHFRVTRCQFERIIQDLGPQWSQSLRSSTSLEKMCMMSIWYLANKESMRFVFNRICHVISFNGNLNVIVE